MNNLFDSHPDGLVNEAPTSRREFHRGALRALLTYSLVDVLLENNVFAESVRPITARWVADLNALSRDVKNETLEQLLWQKKVEELLATVNLPELLRLVDFETLTRKLKFKERGAQSLHFNFKEVAGIPTKLVFGRQIFALKKHCSVMPHGHNNMATAFIVLKGTLHGRHYDRKRDEPKHLLIRPTIDRVFGPGAYSTVSDYRDNIHWFQALSEQAFIFNFHVLGIRRQSETLTGRVYVDPEGETLADGLIRAPILDGDEAKKRFGKTRPPKRLRL
jgi:hypothetical protein